MLNEKNRLKILRRIGKLNLSQNDICTATGIDKGQLSRFLGGTGPIGWGNMEALILSLGGTITKNIVIIFPKK